MHKIHYLLYLFTVTIFLLPGNTGLAATVASVAELENAISQANSGGDPIIAIEPGTYNLDGIYLRITRDGVTVSSTSDNRKDVTLDGNYLTTEIFQIVASHVTIANLTLQRAVDHAIHVMPNNSDITGIVLHNLHIVDTQEQAIKINPDANRAYTVSNGTVSGCLIELSPEGRVRVENDNSNSHPCYTGGIDAHGAGHWQIQDNIIQGFWCTTGLSEHGVHFWSDSHDTVVERNLIIDCDRGIGFGLGSSGHQDGIIRNNMLYHPENHGYSDVGISLESAADAEIYNNTVFLNHDYPNAIEYRFAATSGGIIQNNLCNRAISSRDSGMAILSHNISDALASWFVNIAEGNLHLREPVAGIVDSGAVIPDLTNDFDGEPRSFNPGPDIGADELFIVSGNKFSFLSFLHLLLGTK